MAGQIVSLEHAGNAPAHGVNRVAALLDHPVHQCVFRVTFSLSSWQELIVPNPWDPSSGVDAAIDPLSLHWDVTVPADVTSGFAVVSGQQSQWLYEDTSSPSYPEDWYIERAFFLFLGSVSGEHRWYFVETDSIGNGGSVGLVDYMTMESNGLLGAIGRDIRHTGWSAPFRAALANTPASGTGSDRGSVVFTPMSESAYRSAWAEWWAAQEWDPPPGPPVRYPDAYRVSPDTLTVPVVILAQ